MDVYMNLHTTPLNLDQKKKITKFAPNPTPKDSCQTINNNLILWNLYQNMFQNDVLTTCFQI